MQMILMIAVRARPKRGAENTASAFMCSANGFAPSGFVILQDGNFAAIRQFKP